MSEQNSVHFYLNWAKERIGEMDAAVAAFEAKASEVQADSRTKADQLVADLKKQREEFQVAVKQQTAAGEAAWQRNRSELEAQWRSFEAQVNSYLESLGKKVEQQQAMFRDIAAAQMKAWFDVAGKFSQEAASLAAAKRSDIDAAVARMKANAAEAEAELQKATKAGAESWKTLSAALTESREAFDRANKEASDALKKALPPQQ